MCREVLVCLPPPPPPPPPQPPAYQHIYYHNFDNYFVLSFPVTEDMLRVTSSAVRVVEGGSVELVCEASLRGGDGVCLSYNVTWVTNGSRDGGRDTLTADSETSLDMDGHVLRISQVLNTSVYCCLVHAGGTVVEECTTVYVVRENGMPKPN